MLRLLQDTWLAFALLSRLPLPKLPDGAFARAAAASWAFPLVGFAVALLAGLLGLLALSIGLSSQIAAGLTLTALVLLTGALHEDGLADTADGLFGGWTPERRLEIMKDSRVGAYGMLSMILGLGLRWSALAMLLPAGLGPLIAAAVLSRGILPWLMHRMPSARPGGLAGSVGRPAAPTAIAALLIALVLAFATTGAAAFAAVLATGLAALVVARLAMARIGGQTGDILGATQQVAEIAALLTFAALLP
tara:strand:+ start:1042 stop:1788 length:747 start_codon:yes stop_codon:yes gene_type:complete